MTVIVAKREKGKIVLASDNQSTWGDYKLQTATENTCRAKIQKISDDFAVLGAGLIQEISIFQRYCQRNKPKGATENDIFDFMVEFKNYLKDKMPDFKFETNYIIIFLGKIFEVFYGYQVHEKKNYATAGSGMFCANVAIDLGADSKRAVEMAIKHDLYCGGEVQIVEIITK